MKHSAQELWAALQTLDNASKHFLDYVDENNLTFTQTHDDILGTLETAATKVRKAASKASK